MNVMPNTQYTALRRHGVCQGTLWRQCEKQPLVQNSGGVGSGSSHGMAAAMSSSKQSYSDYCVLAGSIMECFESRITYRKGADPTFRFHIVGASAAGQQTTQSKSNKNNKKQRDGYAALVSFRMVTSQGTHILCQAPTKHCLDVWLAALYAGLEQSLVGGGKSSSEVLPAPQPAKTLTSMPRGSRYCRSCGAVDDSNPSTHASSSHHSSSSSYSVGGSYSARVLCAASPLNQYGKESRCDICESCRIAQGLLNHLEFVKACLAAADQERTAVKDARKLCAKVMQQAAPAAGDNDGDDNARSAVDEEVSLDGSSSWTQVSSDGSRSKTPSPPDLEASSPTGGWHAVQADSQQPWVHLPPSAAGTKALLSLLQDQYKFGSLVRLSPELENLSKEFTEGRVGAGEFLEQIEEEAGGLDESSSSDGSDNKALLIKQALRVGGDMGSAMRRILDHALPNTTDSASRDREHTEHLAAILEFFLDLCQEGELSSVAFFWPQLCHIHLVMLPPRTYADLARIDLMEDFLITVTCRYSIHLALDLVWSHTADLEDSLATAPCTAACRRRRFAVIRFICEFESVLFDFEGAWGGGTVSLGRMLCPTSHQMDLFKSIMKQIQATRDKVPGHRLSRSARYDKLNTNRLDLPPDEAVREKLRIAKHADYFSSHLNFSKRICDIAEKLRFMELSERHAALQQELELLNSSGAMGGDPLNVWHKEHLTRVVRVPVTEGHVFRSKERTPVLLLTELVSEGTEMLLGESEDDSVTEQPRKGLAKSVVEADADGDASGTCTAEEEKKNLDEVNIGPTAALTDSSLPPLGEAAISEDGSELYNPLRQRASTVDSISSDAFDETKPSPRHALALKRFSAAPESPLETPTTPKQDIEKLLTTVVAQQLNKDVDIPDLTKKDQSTGQPLKPQVVEKWPGGEEDGETKDRQGSPVTTPTCRESCESPEPKQARKTSTLSNLATTSGDASDNVNAFAATGDIRREVLTAIMIKGFRGDTIAAGAADSVQRTLQELDRKRATELLLLHGDEKSQGDEMQTDNFVELESTEQKMASLGIGTTSPKILEAEVRVPPTEEDEAMEAIRLLLLQNRVAQGLLSPEDAAKVLEHSCLTPVNSPNRSPDGRSSPKVRDTATIDAGDVDSRLVGCGPLPPAVLQALTLWKAGMVTNGELLELVKKDVEFVRHSVLFDAEHVDKLAENSDFWGRFAFGERWAEKKARIAATSPQGSLPGWDLTGIIVKSNDDLRQEAFVMQLIDLCQEAFDLAGLELWVCPYRILSTGRSTGIIEMVRNAMSLDSLKKRPGYGKGGLREHLQRMTEFTADPGEAFKSAQRNFVCSLAAYSLMSHFFLFKDRHNGNILLDTAGHVIHIDFGFVFGIAPGGSFSLEMSTPFKLTEEMLDVMGGLRSPLFSEFVTLFCCGFLALQSYCDTFLTLVEITCGGSSLKCFEGREVREVVSKLRERFCPDLSKEETVSFALDLIKQATTSYGTQQYDIFQYLSQGIAT